MRPLPVHHHAHYRVWNRRGYAMNLWSDKKQNEKIDYMHDNPLVRGLLDHVADWPSSSWRLYYLEDRSVLAMDHPSGAVAGPQSDYWGCIHKSRCMRHPGTPPVSRAGKSPGPLGEASCGRDRPEASGPATALESGFSQPLTTCGDDRQSGSSARDPSARVSAAALQSAARTNTG